MKKPSENSKNIEKLIALGEVVSKAFDMADNENIDSAQKEDFDRLIALITEEMKNRSVVKTEKLVKSILTDVLFYHETRADFIIKNHMS